MLNHLLCGCFRQNVFAARNGLKEVVFLSSIWRNKDKKLEFCQTGTSKLGLQIVMHACNTCTSYVATSFHFLLHLFKCFLKCLQQKKCGVRVGDIWKRVLLNKLWMSKEMCLWCDRWQCLFMEDLILKNRAGLKTWDREFLASFFF